MIENIKWFICGSIIGMGVAALIVSTNKNIQKKISNCVDDAIKKTKEIKEITLTKHNQTDNVNGEKEDKLKKTK